MIYRIYSDLPQFKELAFLPGLNILLSEKTLEATERQTRNRAGKTSLIEIIHFLTGADKSALFRSASLQDYSFGMEFDVRESRVNVERSAKRASDVLLRGEIDALQFLRPVQKEIDAIGTAITIANTTWKDVLGSAMFQLHGEDQEDARKFAPRFRMLFSYFVRRQMAGAFNSPYKQADMQQVWDYQVAIFYLLGLDWTIPSDWQNVREQERMLRELRKATKNGTLPGVVGSSADIRTRLAVTEDNARRLRERLETFRVLPQYHDLEVEGASISRELGSLSDDNTLDRALITRLKQSLETETVPAYDDLSNLYEEAGVVLPDLVIKRFDDVKAFHDSVVQNRRTYLNGEIEAAQRRIQEREQTQERLVTRQREILRILRSHGALDQYAQLEAEFTRVEGETDALRKQLATAEQVEGKRTELDIERTRLLRRLQQDFSEQRDVLQRAILAFEQVSSALYEQAGSLTIEASTDGPEFDIRIQGARSKGIGNMQIFCFDMMLMRLCQERGIGPKFLVHDSHLFDGVDVRQVANALQVGASIAQEIGIQYVVTLNSDTISRTMLDELGLSACVLPVQLTDAHETGGLFGIRFD